MTEPKQEPQIQEKPEKKITKILSNGEKVELISSTMESEDDIKLINIGMKPGREAFWRAPFTWYDWAKLYNPIAFILMFFKLFCGFGALFWWFVFFTHTNILERFFGLHPLMKKAIRHMVNRPGGLYCLFMCGIYYLNEYEVTEEEMQQISADLPGHVNKNPPSAEELARAKEYENIYNKKPFMVVSNHPSFIDSVAVLSQVHEITFIMNKSVEKFPFMGPTAREVGAILLDESTKGKVIPIIQEKTKQYYKNRFDYCRLMIFPESTTSNGSHLLRFHTGAFVPGVPVQPVVIRYRFKYFNPAWCGMIGHDLQYILMLCSQFFNMMDIINFPAYVPSFEEQKNPELFAENVRKVMCRGANLRTKQTGGELKLAKEKFHHFAKESKSIKKE